MDSGMAPLVEVLGCAQDAGVPHLGCECDACSRAREDPSAIRYATALSLADGTGRRYLFDATPDLRFQVAAVPDGVFLTHAHLGHLPGLLVLGREGVDATGVPVYCTQGLADVIRANDPLALLVERGTVSLTVVADGEPVTLGDVTVTPRAVPHRESLPTGTLSYEVSGPERTLYYASDVDEWTAPTVEHVAAADVALVDGTFWSGDEIGRVDEVPHPPMEASMERLADVDTDVRFVHLNHTNPVLDPDSPERGALVDRGFAVAERGTTVEL